MPLKTADHVQDLCNSQCTYRNQETVDRVREERALFPERYNDIVHYRLQEVLLLRFGTTVFYGHFLSPWTSNIVPVPGAFVIFPQL